MKFKFPLSLLVLCFFISACIDNDTYELSSNSLYFNSFENSDDLEEHGIASLSDDTPQNGGDNSLVISGGCIAPHFQLEVGPFDESVNVSLNLFAKTMENMQAGISMHLESDPSESIRIKIDSDSWTEYNSADHLTIPEGEKVIVSFFSGGLIPVTTYYDLLEIRKED